MGRRVKVTAVAVFVVGAVAAITATAASAAIVRLANGHILSYQPTIGTTPAPSHGDAVFSNLDYSGGPVMPSNVNTTIVWQPPNYTGTPFQSAASGTEPYIFGVNQYLQDVAHDSGGQGNADAVSAQYNDATGATAAYASTYGGSLTDTDSLPANGCPALTGDICITDIQIQHELNTFLTAHNLPHDMTHEYFVLTPPDVASCFDAAGTQCSANADQNTAFCGYHAMTVDGFIYANIPDLTGNPSCDLFASYGLNYPNSFADGVLSTLAHEHNESTTDPEPNNAWTDWQAGCGVNPPETCGGEIGDKCAYYQQYDPNTVLANNTAYNQVIDGRGYWLQPEWSNQESGTGGLQAAHCLDTWTSNGHLASASFTQGASTGTTVSFDASASSGTGGVKEYVWQFNDGSPVPQTSSIETHVPTLTHTFPHIGLYNVALTVMTSDGTSNATAHAVAVGKLPVPAFGFSPGTPLEGATVAFDGTASSDPNTGQTITSYAWSFGDGTTATGATASHAFTAGTYTVQLTVTDKAGLSASVTHTITVTDESPTAAFTAPSGVHTGTPASFDATASSDPDGSITSYAWSFGDGGSGSGRTASHTYLAPGTFTVTLTVTDSSGQKATISRAVAVVAVCEVPRLGHKSLKQAGKLLRTAHCSVGKVKKPKHKPRRKPGRHKVWKLLVVHQSLPATKQKPAGTKVALKLGWVAVKR
jgi:PKD repeat protein